MQSQPVIDDDTRKQTHHNVLNVHRFWSFPWKPASQPARVCACLTCAGKGLGGSRVRVITKLRTTRPAGRPAHARARATRPAPRIYSDIPLRLTVRRPTRTQRVMQQGSEPSQQEKSGRPARAGSPSATHGTARLVDRAGASISPRLTRHGGAGCTRARTGPQPAARLV